MEKLLSYNSWKKVGLTIDSIIARAQYLIPCTTYVPCTTALLITRKSRDERNFAWA